MWNLFAGFSPACEHPAGGQDQPRLPPPLRCSQVGTEDPPSLAFDGFFFLKCYFHEFLSGNTRKAQEFTESFETARVLLLFPLEFLLASRYCSSNFADLFAPFSLAKCRVSCAAVQKESLQNREPFDQLED
jgi:hypothetical protein